MTLMTLNLANDINVTDQMKPAGVAADGEAEEDDLHDGQREDEQHHADVAPHAEEVLLDQRLDLAARRELEPSVY